MYLIGILQALGIVLVDVFYNLYIKFTGVNFDIKAMTFPFYYLIGNALTMMIFAGPGRFALDTVKNISTWIYGVAYLGSFVVEIYLVQYVSSTELSILLRLTVPVCILLSFIVRKRVPSKHDLISLAVIGISLFIVLSMQDATFLVNVVWLCITLAFLEAMGYFIPENHSTNEKAIKESGLRGQMRVISFATFITSTLMFIVLILFCLLNEKFMLTKMLGLSETPVYLDDFIHLPTVLSGLIFGCFFAPFIRFFQWSASYKITSEGVLTIMAIIPLMTFVLEWFLIAIGFQPSSPLFESDNMYVLLAVSIFMAVGSWLAAYLKSAEQLNKIEGNSFWDKVKNAIKLKESMIGIGYSVNKMPDYEAVKITMDFYKGDFKQAAKVLEMPEDTLKTLFYGKSNYSLRPEHSQKLHRAFRNKIFYLDQLTKIENRKGFELYFDSLKLEGVEFSLFYLDVNKFKFINDTYGHNVGDEILIAIAERIQEFVSDYNGRAYRLGGDEFALIVPKSIGTEEFIEKLRAFVTQAVDIKESELVDSIHPEISVGSSNVLLGEDVKVKDVLKAADENMYEEKKEAHAKA